MGLDMYLYATGKNHRRVKELAKARAVEFRKWIEEFSKSKIGASIEKMPKLESGYLDRSKLTAEDRAILAEIKSTLRKKAHSLGGILRRDMHYAYLVKEGEDDPVLKIEYWGKEWPLHEFIIENFGNPQDDNLVEVYLDEAALSKLIENYPHEESFKVALYIVKGGGEVFYKPWY